MKYRVDHTGARFGQLVAVREGERTSCNRVTWLCRCDCGNEKQIAAISLVTGATRSCGCYKQAHLGDYTRTHAMSGGPEHRCWTAMKNRCFNPRSKTYQSYGAKGITVCDRWANSFEKFYEDMGPRPSLAHSLDRYPNQRGNYEPGNVRWATAREQARNMSRNRYIWFHGKRLLITDVADIVGVSCNTVSNRIQARKPINGLRFSNDEHKNHVP